MKSRELFNVGCKLLGLYLLLLSFPGIGNALLFSATPAGFQNEAAGYMLLIRSLVWLIPIIYVIAGIYMLRSAKIVHAFAYPDRTDDGDFSNEAVLPLAFKVIGLYLITTEGPDLIHPIASYLAMKNTPSLSNFLKERIFDARFFPAAAKVLIGLYLLRNGNLFLKLACSGHKTACDSEKDE